jgi:hypothetical protein
MQENKPIPRVSVELTASQKEHKNKKYLDLSIAWLAITCEGR